MAHKKVGPGIAPHQLICEDFRVLDSQVTLRTTWEVERLVLMQSVEGHAHMGHGEFRGRTYPNTTQDDIARALKLSPAEAKAARQLLINEIKDFTLRLAAGEDLQHAVNRQGEPLLRIGFLRVLNLDRLAFLRGVYAGGLRDTPEIRGEAERKYGIRVGSGKSYVVDKRVMHDLGLSGDKLARESHEHDIERFRRAGLIVADTGPGDGNLAYMYIRYRTGPGASDDAAIVMAGKLWGLSAAVGSFLADAVDTLEKYVPVYSDQDDLLALEVERMAKDLGIGREEVVRLAFLAAIPEGEEGTLPDSSLRYMLAIDRHTDQSALESHLLYVGGRPYSQMALDYCQTTNIEFYKYIERRLAEERK